MPLTAACDKSTDADISDRRWQNERILVAVLVVCVGHITRSGRPKVAKDKFKSPKGSPTRSWAPRGL